MRGLSSAWQRAGKLISDSAGEVEDESDEGVDENPEEIDEDAKARTRTKGPS